MNKKWGIILLAGAIGAVALCSNLCAFNQPEGLLLIKRQDTLECGLKDGSKFVLRARYLWDPIAELIPADITTRYGSGYVIEFHPRKGIAQRIPGTLDYYPGMWSWNTEVCSEAYIAGDIISGWGMNFSRATGKPISLPDPPPTFQVFFDTATAHPIRFDKRGLIHQLIPLTTVSSAAGSRVVYELAMIETNGHCHVVAGARDRCPIVAAYQSISTDNGKTWSDPVVTIQAEIFELGKTMEEQSFVAKPIRINGKSVERLEREAKRKAEQEDAAREGRQREIEEIWRKRDEQIFGR